MSTRRIPGFALGLALVASLVAGACGGSSSSSSSSLTAPSTPPTSETFTGTVPVGGNDIHPFNILLSGGQVNITLTQAGPPSTIYMGLGIGTWTSPTCTLLTGGIANTPAAATAQLSGTTSAGSYCISVYDIGNQTADVTYSVTVTHY